MKKLIVAFATSVLIWLVYQLGFMFGITAFVFIMTAVLLIRKRVDYFLTLSVYKKLIENSYIVSCHPKTGEVIVFDDDIDDLIEWVPFKSVIAEAADERRWLTEAGNEHFCDSDLQDHERLQIRTIIFRDGEHINESWSAFAIRVRDEVEADRAERHRILKAADEDWYHQYGNDQQGVSWVRPGK